MTLVNVKQVNLNTTENNKLLKYLIINWKQTPLRSL